MVKDTWKWVEEGENRPHEVREEGGRQEKAEAE